MTIFKRDCPECAAANPMDAVVCACGYCFDPDTLAATDPQAYARQQDRLYLEYLTARVRQAQADTARARQAAYEAAGDRQKVAAARTAEAGLAALRTELNEWSRRVRASARPAAPPRAAAPRPPGPTPMPAPAPKRQPPPARTGGQPPALSPGARQAPQAPSPKVTADPGASFKRRQAEKAEAVVQSGRASTPPRPSLAPGSASPRGAPARAARAPGTRECPNCTARVAPGAARCRCGYTFPRTGDEMPTLSLDATALSILADGVTLTGPTRRR